MARGIASSCPPGRALARSAALAALAAGAAAALPASAGAATVTVGHEPGLKYVAGGGEVNRLAVSAADGWLLLSDPGADAIALAGAGAAAACEQIAPTRVRCREDAFTKVKADLLDGDDGFESSVAGRTSVDAGEGDDVVVGGDGDDELNGDAGDDYVSGGRGTDALGGGPGEDRLVARDGAGELPACGEGADVAVLDVLDVPAEDCEERLLPGAADDQPPAGDGAGPAAPGTSAPELPPPPAPDILMPVGRVAVTQPRLAVVRIGCSAGAVDGCRGEVVIEAPVLVPVRAGERREVGAARGRHVTRQRRIGRKRFNVGSGKSVDTRVRISHRGHHTISRKRRVRGRLKVVQRDITGKVLGVSTRPIWLERKWARRSRRSK